MPSNQPFVSSSAASLFALWDTLRAGQPYPAWSDLDVTELRPWMGWLFLLDFPDPASDVGQFAVFGDGLAALFDADATGLRTDAGFFGPDAGMLVNTFGLSRRLGQPTVSRSLFRSRGGQAVGYEQLLLPFTYHTEQPPDRLLGLVRLSSPAEPVTAPVSAALSWDVQHEQLIGAVLLGGPLIRRA